MEKNDKIKEYEEKHTATVGQLIEFLKKNFNPDDRVCYMDCVEGVKNDCSYVNRKELGDRFFYYVSKLKEWQINEHKMSKKDADEMYSFVKDSDVIVV